MMAKVKEERSDVHVLEQGNIYFFYRPAVQEEEPADLAAVQRTYVILAPHDEERYRLIVPGRKHLPDPEEHERYWGYVGRATASDSELREDLREKTYETETRGTRRRPAARPAGEGVYAIVRRGRQTYLAYVLELPEKPDEVQQALDIKEEGSYVLSIKNPTISPEQGLDPDQRADFPQELSERFDGRRWIPAGPPDFLDYDGAEILLIGASENIRQELGIEIEADDELPDSADIFRDLHLRKSEHPVEPLFEGQWE